MNASPPPAAGRRRFWRHLREFGSWLARREELPRVADETPNFPSARTALSFLASSERLARREPRSDHPRQMLTWLVSRDRLPSLPATQRQRGGLVPWLISPEQLPTNPSDAAPAPRSFLHWLLTTDSHERLADHASTKEVPLHEP